MSELFFCAISVIRAFLVGDLDFCSEYNNQVSQKQIPASNGAFLTKDDEFLHFEEPFCASKSCSSFTINANEENWNNAGMLCSCSGMPHFWTEVKIH